MFQYHDSTRSKGDQEKPSAQFDAPQTQSEIYVLGQYIHPTLQGLTKVEQNLDRQRDAVQTCKNLNAILVIQCVATSDAGRKARANERSLTQQLKQIEETKGEVAALREQSSSYSEPITAGLSTSGARETLNPRAPNFLGPRPDPETDGIATLRYIDQVLSRGSQMLKDHSVWYDFFRRTHEHSEGGRSRLNIGVTCDVEMRPFLP